MGFRGSRVQIPASRPTIPRIFKNLAQPLKHPNRAWDIPGTIPSPPPERVASGASQRPESFSPSPLSARTPILASDDEEARPEGTEVKWAALNWNSYDNICRLSKNLLYVKTAIRP